MEVVSLCLSCCREVDECENLVKMSHGEDFKSHLSVVEDGTRKSYSQEVYRFFD